MVGDDIRDDVIGAQDAGFQVNHRIHVSYYSELIYFIVSMNTLSNI